MSEWLPIVGAPRDGTLIVGLVSRVYGTYNPVLMRWHADEAYPWLGKDGNVYREAHVKYWYPLPRMLPIAVGDSG